MNIDHTCLIFCDWDFCCFEFGGKVLGNSEEACTHVKI